MSYLMLLLSLPCFSTFCSFAIPTSCNIFRCFFTLVYITFLAVGACLSQSFPSVTEQQVCPQSQASSIYAILTEESLTMLFSNTETPMDDEDSPCLIHAQ